jgi:hypothetical protein
MTDELVRKIQHLLHRRIRNEMRVVYLLVELRKLMDREKYNDPILKTMSNWVVHTASRAKFRHPARKLLFPEHDGTTPGSSRASPTPHSSMPPVDRP